MRNLSMPALFAVLLLLAAALPLQAEEVEAVSEDPWTGMDRTELIRLLGEPRKIKKAGREGETLVYRFHRVDPANPPAPGVPLVTVPGIGLVASIDALKLNNEAPMSIERTEFDRSGRPSGGRASSSQTASSSYDPKSGELRRKSTTTDNPPVKGRVKLRFILDANAQVAEWSVSGKK